MGIPTGAKVKKITFESSEELTYNMHVDQYNNFPINNGLIVHNCIKAHMYALEPLSKNRGKPSTLSGSKSDQKKDLISARVAERKKNREIIKAQRKKLRNKK